MSGQILVRCEGLFRATPRRGGLLAKAANLVLEATDGLFVGAHLFDEVVVFDTADVELRSGGCALGRASFGHTPVAGATFAYSAIVMR